MKSNDSRLNKLDSDFFGEFFKENVDAIVVVDVSEAKAVGQITCSIGITEIKEGDEANAAFERMDKALYEAKAEGRNCIRSIMD